MAGRYFNQPIQMEMVTILRNKRQHQSFKSWICNGLRVTYVMSDNYVSNSICVQSALTGTSASILGDSGCHCRSAGDLERDVEMWTCQELKQSPKVQKNHQVICFIESPTNRSMKHQLPA